MTQPETDRQNAMRDRGERAAEGDVLARVREIRKRVGWHHYEPWIDITDDTLSLCAQIERDQAELAQVQDLIDACADAQANGEPLPAAVDAATSVLVDAGAASIQKLTAPPEADATPSPQQASPRQEHKWSNNPGQTDPHCEICGEVAMPFKHTFCLGPQQAPREAEDDEGPTETLLHGMRTIRGLAPKAEGVASWGTVNAMKLAAAITAAEQAARAEDREEVAAWMLNASIPMGHGDTIEDLLDAIDAERAERAAKLSAVEADYRDTVGCLTYERKRFVELLAVAERRGWLAMSLSWRQILNRYRYAVSFFAADSWDAGSEVRRRFEWARSYDAAADLSPDSLARIASDFHDADAALAAAPAAPQPEPEG